VRVGILHATWTSTLADMRDEVAWAATAGAHTYWLAQVWRYDAFTLIPSLAADAPDLQFGTSVVATFQRHPMTMASQALTANLLTGGRFTLGIGLMHKPVIEGMFGLSFDKPVRHMNEYLDILLPLLAQKPADVSGAVWTYRGSVDVPGAPECPLLLAALGPEMLSVCGRRTAGTITWMTGPRTIHDHVVPTLTAAAESAGRPAPRVVALVPVHVTDDVADARARAARVLGMYGTMPSYRAMLDREGFTGPEDFALIGSEDAVRDGLERYRAAGATDVGISVAAPTIDRDRTREFIANFLARP
jgi:F420-dependent oxidoreductase-like protein